MQSPAYSAKLNKVANQAVHPLTRLSYLWRLWSLKGLDFLAYVGTVTSFGFAIGRRLVTPPFIPADQALEQFALLVKRCFFPVIAMEFAVGAVITLESTNIFKLISAEPLLGGISSIFTLRELGPVLAGVMVASQGGTSVSTEIGAMKIRQEFDALELMATDPLRFAIAPRFLAFILAMPLLTLMANLSGIAGGFFMSMAVSDLSPMTYLNSILDYVTLLDIWNGMFKAVAFGIAVASISCHAGFAVRGGSADVGRAANRSVVNSIIAVLMLNYFLTTIFFGTSAGIQKF